MLAWKKRKAKEAMGKDAGKAPDFRGAAEEQAASGQQAIDRQTTANRPGQTSPFASTQWTQGPDGRWQQNTGFTGGLGQAAQGLQSQAGGLANPMDWNQLGAFMDGSQARREAIDSTYGEASKRLDERFGKSRDAMHTQLLNQGLDPNSQAYRNAMREQTLGENDAYGSAMNNAIQSGTAAGDSLFRNNMASREQRLAEALQQRRQPLEEMGQLGGFLNFMPGFNAAGAGQGTNYMDALGQTGNWNMQNAQMRNQFWGDLAGGLMGLGGSAIKFSDERVKRDIQRLPSEAIPGVPFATWEWREKPGIRHVGVIAQDVEKVAPECVGTAPNGFKTVDYSKLREMAERGGT